MKKTKYNFITIVGTVFILVVSTSIIQGQAFPIEYGSVWKYLDDGSCQDTAWRQLDYDDSGWAEGPAPLGYHEDEATTIDFGPDPANKFLCYYFRQKFSISNAVSATSVNCEFLVDDGLVIWLNGKELERLGFDVTDTVNCLSTSEDADVGLWNGIPRNETMVYNYTNAGAAALLREGLNVCAVEVHQSEGKSSDLRFHLQITIDGDVTVVTGVEQIETLPKEYNLSNAYPNPFNPSTTINFSLPKSTNVKLEVFDALGRVLATLADEVLQAGSYKYNWNASGLPSGTYLYRIIADEFISTNKLILMK